MREIKNIVIYIVVCIIILISFKLPEILCERVNDNIEIAVYEKEKIKSTIDVEAEKIYLVKAIHDIESEKSKVAISSSDILEKFTLVEVNTKTTNDIYKELLKLKEYNILNNFETNENFNYKVGLVDKFYNEEGSEYIINSIDFQVNNDKYKLEIESKTGKILYIVFEDNLYSSKEEIMRNYIKYLDLYIIDDWKMENNMLKSEKAELVVSLIENENHYILSIHSVDKIFNIFDYTDVLNKIDTP